jgi:surface antigen
MRPTLLMIALAPLALSGCQSVGSGAAPPAPAAAALPAEPPAPAIQTGSALGGVLGGPVGASLTDDDRAAAWNAQIAALNSGQRRSWRGAQGVFGLVEPGQTAGGGCRAYSQTIFIAGRAHQGGGVGCRQADGSWKMTS